MYEHIAAAAEWNDALEECHHCISQDRLPPRRIRKRPLVAVWTEV